MIAETKVAGTVSVGAEAPCEDDVPGSEDVQIAGLCCWGDMMFYSLMIVLILGLNINLLHFTHNSQAHLD